MKISLNQVILPARDLRAEIDDDKIEELAASLRDVGLLQPIGVRKIQDHQFEVVYGARRTRAAKFLEWETIEANIVENGDETQIHAKKLIENVQREDLTPIEEAYGLLDLIGNGEPDIRKLRQQTGKSRDWLVSRLELVALPDDVQQLVQAGVMTMSVARHLGTIQHEETRRQYCGYAVENGCTEALAKQWLPLAHATESGLLSAEQGLEQAGQLSATSPAFVPIHGCFICRGDFEVTNVATVVVCRSCFSGTVDDNSQFAQPNRREPRLPS